MTRSIPARSMVVDSIIALLTATLAASGAAADDTPMKLAADAASPGDQFGHAVAISGDRLVVGADRGDLPLVDAGTAYLFDAGDGTTVATLTSGTPTTAGRFGDAVAIGGGLVAVGARYERVEGVAVGAVHLFSATDGSPLGRLVAPDGESGDEFGASLAIGDGLVFVGAPRRDDDGGDSGAVLVFDAATRDHVRTITPADGSTLKIFGGAIAVDGGRLLIGAQGDSTNGFLAGAAYVFDSMSGRQRRKLLPGDGASNDFFGSAVAIDGDRLLVGAWSKSIVFDHSGAAYLFDAIDGEEITRLVPADAADRDNFGRSLALSGDVAAIGAPKKDGVGFESGVVYFFNATNGGPISSVEAPDAEAGDRFGGALTLAGDRLAIGAELEDDHGNAAGTVYLYGASGTGGGSPCPADLNRDGMIDAADLGTLLSGWGSDGPGADLAAPFDQVDAADLGVMLGGWGDCGPD